MSYSAEDARISNVVNNNKLIPKQQPPIKGDDNNNKTADTDDEIDNNVQQQEQQYLQKWLRPDCYTLYQTCIFPSKSIPIKKRIGMIRYSINVAYNMKRKYPHAQFLQFGVATGKDMIRIMNFLSYKEQHSSCANNNTTRTIIHGFDSFHGLPEIWDNGQVNNETGQAVFGQGHFNTGGHVPQLDVLQQTMRICHHGSNNSNNNNKYNQCPVEFHVGLFQDTVPAFFNHNQQYATAPIAFIHADADLYSSTLTFLEEICLRRLLIPGSVILFDEYTNYLNWQDGEFRAWMEICNRYKLDFDYLCHHAPPSPKNTVAMIVNKKRALSTYGYQSVSVIITKVGGGGGGGGD